MSIFDYHKYHFIGIGGIGISAIARMLYMQGKTITGSDNAESEITEDLKNLGISVAIGQEAENISEDAEVVIYTIAIPPENPEIKKAREKGLLIVTYPEALGELSKHMFTIAVAGTHGKTTTTAMIGHILKKAGFDPTIIVGSKMLGYAKKENTNFLAGKSKYLVVEACEYRRSFLNLFPNALIITNIDNDHLDYYKDMKDIQSAFHQMMSQAAKDGFIVTRPTDPNIKEPIKGIVAKVLDYESISPEIELLLAGKHNIWNAQAAIQTAVNLGINEDIARQALKDFKGTWRRLQYKGEKNGNIFYDDYAHHPTEIQASLSALKEKHPDKKIICIFEPHQQARTKLMFDDLVESLRTANRVFIAPIFISREIADNSISNKTLAEAVNQFVPSLAVENSDQLKIELEKLSSAAPSCIVFMGAGDIYKWTIEILVDN